jgi:pimeloyl-ACP methyl ester carboxylesterase
VIGRRTLLAAAALAACPARAQGVKERPVRFAGVAGAELAGTLMLPMISEMQYVPGVVLIAGSGPTDRDGNNPLAPARIDLLKLLALALADAGIATLRYDKRGIGASTLRPRGTLEEQERFFAWPHFVDDVRAAHVEMLRHDEIKPYATALLGHSEGGLLAMAAAAGMGPVEGSAKYKQAPYALVLAATPGRPLGEIVRQQIAREAPEFVVPAGHVMDAIAATGHVPDNLPRALQALFPPYVGLFLRDAFAFDPVTALERLDTACLLLQGAADQQVVALHDVQPLIDALQRRTAPGEAFIAPLVSHNLKSVAGPADDGFSGPLSPVIAARLVAWLAHVLGA